MTKCCYGRCCCCYCYVHMYRTVPYKPSAMSYQHRAHKIRRRCAACDQSRANHPFHTSVLCRSTGPRTPADCQYLPRGTRDGTFWCPSRSRNSPQPRVPCAPSSNFGSLDPLGTLHRKTRPLFGPASCPNLRTRRRENDNIMRTALMIRQGRGGMERSLCRASTQSTAAYAHY